MRAVLPVPPGIDTAGVLRYLRMRALPGIEAAGETSYARSLALPDGVAVVRVASSGPDVDAARINAVPDDARIDAVPAGAGPAGPSAGSLTVDVVAGSPTDETGAVGLVRALFDLGTDAGEVDAGLARHPLVARLVAEVPGIRVPRSPDAAEKLVRAIVGQQISVAAARLALTEISAAGDAVPEPAFGVTRLFPTPEQLATRGADLFRAPEARRRTLRMIAEVLADRTLQLDGDIDRVAADLLALRGIGPWTVGYLRLFALGDTDVLLTGDSALRLGARSVLGPDSGEVELRELADAVRPWRSYLGMHLWRKAVPALRGA